MKQRYGNKEEKTKGSKQRREKGKKSLGHTKGWKVKGKYKS